MIVFFAKKKIKEKIGKSRKDLWNVCVWDRDRQRERQREREG